MNEKEREASSYMNSFFPSTSIVIIVPAEQSPLAFTFDIVLNKNSHF
jgi:hypothetical protein